MSNGILIALSSKALFYNVDMTGITGHTQSAYVDLKNETEILEKMHKVRMVEEGEYDNVLKSCKLDKKEDTTQEIYLFEKIKVNGEVVECKKKFCTYIGIQDDTAKTNYGRVRLYFQISTKSSDDSLNIDNKEVYNTISRKVNDETFIVTAFVIDSKEHSLDVKIDRMGRKNIPYNELFSEGKGNGNKRLKLFSNEDMLGLNDIEFSVMCMQLVRKYELFSLIEFLESTMFCKKHFSCKKAILTDSKKEGYINQNIRLNGNKYWLVDTWNRTKTKNSRNDFYDWLLGKIEEVSDDVEESNTKKDRETMDIRKNISKPLIVPNCLDIDDGYEISLTLKDDAIESEIAIGDSVILCDELLSRVKKYAYYKVTCKAEADDKQCNFKLRQSAWMDPVTEKDILKDFKEESNG